MLPPMVEIFQLMDRILLGASLSACSVMISVQSSGVLLVVRMPFVAQYEKAFGELDGDVIPNLDVRKLNVEGL